MRWASCQLFCLHSENGEEEWKQQLEVNEGFSKSHSHLIFRVEQNGNVLLSVISLQQEAVEASRWVLLGSEVGVEADW